MILKSLLFSLLLVFFFYSCHSEEEGKHLFILSGQSNMVGLNLEQSFTPNIESEFGKDRVIIVKDALGSQPISRWYKNWRSPEGMVTAKTGDLYNRLMKKVNDSTKGQKIKTVTFIWMQGERDARMKFGDVYEKSLRGLYEQLCNDLERTDINFVIGRLNDFDMKNEKWPHWTMVRDIQVKVGESNPRFTWVNTDNLNDGFNIKGKKIENDLHMSVNGYKTLGKYFAEGAIRLIKQNVY